MSNIRRLITVILCQMSDNSYMTAEVCCHIFVITRLMSDFMLFYIIVIRRLMSNIRCLITVIRCQTFENSYITADVSCHITVTKHLMLYVMLYNYYQTSDV